jgi:copper oxidase (laccase) domain-containing protein
VARVRAPWDSFNVAGHVGDEAAAVAANRAQLVSRLALPSEPGWLNQVHGNEVVDLDAVKLPTGRPPGRPSPATRRSPARHAASA